MDWADIDDEEHIMLPPPKETKDKNGITTIVSFKVEGKNRIRTTKRIRQYQFEKRVYFAAEERRRTWKKFGDCEKVPPGPEQNITYKTFDEIFMEDPNVIEEEPEDKDAAIAAQIAGALGQGKWRQKEAEKNGTAAGGMSGLAALAADAVSSCLRLSRSRTWQISCLNASFCASTESLKSTGVTEHSLWVMLGVLFCGSLAINRGSPSCSCCCSGRRLPDAERR